MADLVSTLLSLYSLRDKYSSLPPIDYTNGSRLQSASFVPSGDTFRVGTVASFSPWENPGSDSQPTATSLNWGSQSQRPRTARSGTISWPEIITVVDENGTMRTLVTNKSNNISLSVEGGPTCTIPRTDGGYGLSSGGNGSYSSANSRSSSIAQHSVAQQLEHSLLSHVEQLLAQARDERQKLDAKYVAVDPVSEDASKLLQQRKELDELIRRLRSKKEGDSANNLLPSRLTGKSQKKKRSVFHDSKSSVSNMILESSVDPAASSSVSLEQLNDLNANVSSPGKEEGEPEFGDVHPSADEVEDPAIMTEEEEKDEEAAELRD